MTNIRSLHRATKNEISPRCAKDGYLDNVALSWRDKDLSELQQTIESACATHTATTSEPAGDGRDDVIVEKLASPCSFLLTID